MSSFVSCFLEPRLTLFTIRPRPAISGFAEHVTLLKEGRVRPGSRLDGSRASSTTFQLCIKALGRRHGFSAWFLQLSRRSEQEKVRCESVSECSNSIRDTSSHKELDNLFKAIVIFNV
jgi:hypothetical protein